MPRSPKKSNSQLNKTDKQSSSQSSSALSSDKQPEPTSPTLAMLSREIRSAQINCPPLSPAVITSIENNIISKFLADGQVYERLASEMIASVSERVIEGLTASLNSAIKQIVDLQTEVESLKKELKLKEDKSLCVMDDMEQYQRRNNLRVFGVPESPNEDTDKLVIDVCKEKLGVDIELEDIDRSHRVGRKYTAADAVSSTGPRPRPRPIIVKFVSYRQRRAVFTAKKKLQGSGIVLKEDLTRRRLQIYNSIVEQFGYKSVWSYDGIIYWIDSEGKKHSTTNKLEQS